MAALANKCVQTHYDTTDTLYSWVATSLCGNYSGGGNGDYLLNFLEYDTNMPVIWFPVAAGGLVFLRSSQVAHSVMDWTDGERSTAVLYNKKYGEQVFKRASEREAEEQKAECKAKARRAKIIC